MNPLIVIIGLIAMVVILILSLVLGRKPKDSAVAQADSASIDLNPDSVHRNCPLCAAPLKKGQTVKSKVTEIVNSSKFQGPVKESISHVFGCPYCYPANLTFTRHCPVCKADLEAKDYVIGRYFEKMNQKNHLHVLGCTRCRKA